MDARPRQATHVPPRGGRKRMRARVRGGRIICVPGSRAWARPAGVTRAAEGRLDDFAVGDTVRLKVVRGNQEREVTVRLQAGTQ